MGDLSTALPAQARLDDSVKEPRECEVLLRSEIKESFLQSDIGSAFRSGASTEGLGTVDLNTPEFFAKLAAINAEVFAKVGEVFDEVKEECEEFSDVWDPVMTTSSVSRGGEDNFCPNLGSGAYPRGTTYLLMNGDRMPVTVDDIESILLVGIEPKKDAYGEYVLTPNGRYVIDSVTDDPVTEIDFVFLKQSLVLHWEPGAEGSGLGGRGPSSSASASGSIGLGGGGPGSVGGSPMRGFAGIPSGRPQPTLPVDDSRCWICDKELSWRFFDVGRIADPPIEIRETELEWQDRIGWVHNPVASGNGPPPVGTPLVGMPLRLPDRSGYVDWSLLDWFTFNSRRVVAGFPAVEVYSSDGGSTLEPREILVDRYGDRLWDMTVALPGSGVGAQGLRYYDRSLGGHPTTGPRFQERFKGYVDTRPAPAFVISWPTGPMLSGLPLDGPAVGVGYPDLPESRGWYENFVDDYIERTNIHFKKVKPDIDHRSPSFLACNPSAAHNHVVGYGPGGQLAAVGAMPCWVTYRGAVRVPGIYQLATPSPASGMTPEKFPLYRIRDARTGYTQPIRSGGELDDRDYVSAAYDARSCERDGYGGCLEPGRCTYQDHRGMLKTNFTLQEYPQYIGESYEGKSQITGIEDFDGASYDSLLVVAKDSAQGEELDWYQPLKSAEWTFEHNVLDYKRREGFTYVYARLPWTGYRILPNGYIEYTDRLGYNIEINPALLGGCHPLCPYLDERRIKGERMVTKRIRTHTQGGVTSKRYAFHLYGPLDGFAMSELEGAEGHLFEQDITECRYFDDGKVECGNMGKYYGSQWEGDLPYGKLGFVYDMPYPYCPYLKANGMATMENYVVPPWSYVAPEDDLVMDDDPLVDNDRDRLVEFYNSTRGDYWIDTSNWLSAMPLNEWHGVVAVGDRVVSLSLPRNGLSGSLPDRFGEMDQMLHLDLSHNLVGGRLPDSMYDMEVLENLNLADNRFRMGGLGLNDLFAKLLELKYLDLSYNRFYGPFPYPSKFVSEIESIIFSYSGFVNTLPEHLGPFGFPGNAQEDYSLLRPHLFRLELRGNVLDPRCVSNLLADNIPSNDVELLGRGLCD